MLDPKNIKNLKAIEFLLENKTEIFNVTPPNAKDEDKSKFMGKYRLLQENQFNKNWKGFTPSKIDGEFGNSYFQNVHSSSQSNKGSTYSSMKHSNDRRLRDKFGFDPFFSSGKRIEWSGTSSK